MGIGNILWADEGFGVRCVEAMNAAYQFGDDVTVLDGGTQGLYLLPFLEEARYLIVFDAVDYGKPPGEMVIAKDDEVPRFMGVKKMSLHQTGFQEVIACAALGDKLPESMMLIGVQPEQLEDFGGSLRDIVKAQIPRALEVALEQIRQWGYRLCASAIRMWSMNISTCWQWTTTKQGGLRPNWLAVSATIVSLRGQA